MTTPGQAQAHGSCKHDNTAMETRQKETRQKETRQDKNKARHDTTRREGTQHHDTTRENMTRHTTWIEFEKSIATRQDKAGESRCDSDTVSQSRSHVRRDDMAPNRQTGEEFLKRVHRFIFWDTFLSQKGYIKN
jgi:hypothetical protein